MDITKKEEENALLNSFQTYIDEKRQLSFDVLSLEESKRICPNYTGENPDAIIAVDGQYIGIELFRLARRQSTSGVNLYQQDKESTEDLLLQDELLLILKETLLGKIKNNVEHYVTDKVWLLGYANDHVNSGLVRDVINDGNTNVLIDDFRKMVIEEKRVDSNFRKNLTRIDRIFLFEQVNPTKPYLIDLSDAFNLPDAAD